MSTMRRPFVAVVAVLCLTMWAEPAVAQSQSVPAPAPEPQPAPAPVGRPAVAPARGQTVVRGAQGAARGPQTMRVVPGVGRSNVSGFSAVLVAGEMKASRQ